MDRQDITRQRWELHRQMWGRHGHSELVQVRPSQKNVARGVGVNDQIPDLQGFASLI